jgi:hypothetical protein
LGDAAVHEARGVRQGQGGQSRFSPFHPAAAMPGHPPRSSNLTDSFSRFLPKAPFIYRPLCGHLRTLYLFVMDNSTLKGRLRVLRERYYLMVGPLLLVIGVGSNGSPFLTWTAVSLLSLLTINKAILVLRS